MYLSVYYKRIGTACGFVQLVKRDKHLALNKWVCGLMMERTGKTRMIITTNRYDN
jgi:hypothetical protein